MTSYSSASDLRGGMAAALVPRPVTRRPRAIMMGGCASAFEARQLLINSFITVTLTLGGSSVLLVSGRLLASHPRGSISALA